MARVVEEVKARINEIGEFLWSPAARDLETEERRALKREEKTLLRTYAAALEHATFSRCPFCDTLFEVAWDPTGLDGAWWWTTCPVELKPHRACEHYQVFLGAVDLGDRIPEEATETTTLGPARPFVVQRLVDLQGVRAVLSRIETDRGDKVYLTTYFAAEPIAAEDLHQEFRQDKYAVRNDDGEVVGAMYKFDPWEFDLRKVDAQTPLRWIDPGDESWRIQDGVPSPFVDLQGTQMNQKSDNGELSLWSAPHGQGEVVH